MAEKEVKLTDTEVKFGVTDMIKLADMNRHAENEVCRLSMELNEAKANLNTMKKLYVIVHKDCDPTKE